MLVTDKEKNKQAETILHDLIEYINNVQRVMRELGVPENIMQQETMLLPEFDTLLPDEVERIYQKVKFLTITYYDDHGFSQRETSRRLMGESHAAVNRKLKEIKNEKRD